MYIDTWKGEGAGAGAGVRNSLHNRFRARLMKSKRRQVKSWTCNEEATGVSYGYQLSKGGRHYYLYLRI